MTTFNAGDVVKLKSDSPKMTIRWIEEGEAYCEWFAGTEVKGAKFALAQLVEFTPRSPADLGKLARALA